MKIWTWLTTMGKGRDAAALKRAELQATETPGERKLTSGDIDAIKADERGVELTGDTPAESERLAG